MNNSIKIQGDIEKNKIFSVSELNRLVKNILNTTFSLVWIKGEVSGFSSYSSGHWYFKLKDNTAQVDCVMFARKNQQLQWQPKNGDFLELQCQVSLYEANGKYQLIIETMQKAGLGELFEKYIDLKNKLEQAGLFNEATKKLLPRFPRVIGVITSSDGAALRDVLSTLLRRNRSVSIIIYPILVQGAAATSGICNAITKANERNEVDALIICRGGGSIEDLWSFNTESVAYAIFNSILPVISAVGHETDFTIADFVADTRAPTPTAAAEIISEGSNQILSTIDVYLNSMTKMFERKIEQSQLKLNFLERRLISPIQRIAGQKDLLKSYEKRMLLNINAKLESYRNKITRTIIQLPPPKQLIQEKKEQIDTLRRRLEINTRSQITSYSSKILSIKKNLLMLNPKSILKRGYSIVQDVDEKILRDTKNISVDDNIDFIDDHMEKKDAQSFTQNLKKESMEIGQFLKTMGPALKVRVAGTAVFLTPNPEGIPHALLHNLKHNKVLHEKVILLTVRFRDYPHAKPSNLVKVEKLTHNFYKVIITYGFKDETRIPKDLARCKKHGIVFDPMDTSYFIGKESLITNSGGEMSYLRKKIFVTMFRSAENISNQFHLPVNRVVELGSQVLF